MFPAFGTNAAISAELTVGDAGQAGIVSPVRVESTGAVCLTVTLVEEALMSVFICEEYRYTTPVYVKIPPLPLLTRNAFTTKLY